MVSIKMNFINGCLPMVKDTISCIYDLFACFDFMDHSFVLK